MTDFEVKVDNTQKTLQELERQVAEALEVAGGTIEGWAIDLAPVGTEETTGIPGYMGGSLRSTIRHEMEDDRTVMIEAGGEDGIYRYVDYAV